MEAVKRNRSAPFLTKDGSGNRSILDQTNSTEANQSPGGATLPPGAETEEHCHPRVKELYDVLRGRRLMILEREGRGVGPGDGVLIPPGTRHRIRTLRRQPLVFLCSCFPPYSHQDTILTN